MHLITQNKTLVVFLCHWHNISMSINMCCPIQISKYYYIIIIIVVCSLQLSCAVLEARNKILFPGL